MVYFNQLFFCLLVKRYKFRGLYVKKNKIWKLYWLRQNLKWHAYEPDGINQHLEPLFDIVQEDKQACFWG